MYSLVFACTLILFLCGLIYSEFYGNRKGIYLTKPLASLSFIGIALTVSPTGGHYFLLIFLGLLLGMGGDIALMLPGDKNFLAGLVLFLLGHVAYVAAFGNAISAESFHPKMTVFLVLLCLGIFLYLRPHLGKFLLPVIVYMVVILAMVLMAWHRYYTHPYGAGTLNAAVGATLFFFSDVAVAQDKFVKQGFLNRAWGLPAYYFGQMLIAFSVAGQV